MIWDRKVLENSQNLGLSLTSRWTVKCEDFYWGINNLGPQGLGRFAKLGLNSDINMEIII